MKKTNVRIFSASAAFLVGLIGLLALPAFTADKDRCAGEIREIIYEGDIGVKNVLYKVGLKTVDDRGKILAADEIYTDDFGGAFVDDDGQLIILLTENSKSFKNAVHKSSASKKLFQSRKGIRNILIKPAKFSEKELMLANDYLVERMEQLNILSVSVDTIHNGLEIGILKDRGGFSNTEKNALESEIKSAVSRVRAISDDDDDDVEEMLSFVYLTNDFTRFFVY